MGIMSILLAMSSAALLAIGGFYDTGFEVILIPFGGLGMYVSGILAERETAQVIEAEGAQ